MRSGLRDSWHGCQAYLAAPHCSTMQSHPALTPALLTTLPALGRHFWMKSRPKETDLLLSMTGLPASALPQLPLMNVNGCMVTVLYSSKVALWQPLRTILDVTHICPLTVPSLESSGAQGPTRVWVTVVPRRKACHSSCHLKQDHKIWHHPLGRTQLFSPVSIFKDLFVSYVYGCLLPAYMSGYHVLAEVRRMGQSLWNWSYRWL